MKPALPDTPVFRALGSLSGEDLAEEIRQAERMVTAWQTYLDWVRLTAQMQTTFGDGNGPGDPLAGSVASRTTLRIRTAADERPPLRRAILMILSEDPRRWRKRELYDELERRGWLPRGKTPDKQLTNRLTEMARDGQVQRHGPGIISLGGQASDED